jgi:hypothetical protein
MKEQLLMRFKLPSIESLSMIEAIVSMSYRKTGNKFSVIFNGSKGYLDNIEIACEGNQTEENRLFVENLRNKDGRLKSIMVNLFYSDKNGIRVSTGEDEPKTIEEEKQEIVEHPDIQDNHPDNQDNDDGLPF